MMWHLACDECAKGMEIKSIGVFWTNDVCEICGRVVPRFPLNGMVAGNPLTEEQVTQAKTLRDTSRGVSK
jgi:hypothetical protein